MKKDLNDRDFDQWEIDEGNARDLYMKNVPYRAIKSGPLSKYADEGQSFIDAYMRELGYKY